MKRSRNQQCTRENKKSRLGNEETIPGKDIDQKFLNECEIDFYKNPSNIITRNAIVSIGSMITTIDSKRVNHINHVFMNSIKKKNTKATNQGRSGRCWMFAGLNIFRHTVIKALDLEDFEFSETYLFFWDKLERANTFLRWFIDHPEVKTDDESFKYIIEDYYGDGGWWNMFANLVIKYGLLPKSSMKETWQSMDSQDMNDKIHDCVQACANYIFTHRNLPQEELLEIKKDTMKQVYKILVKFLGDPPKKFRWSYINEDDDSNIITGLSPHKFKNMCIPGINLTDFVVLTHLPGKLKEKQLYEVKYTSNVYEGENFRFLNTNIHELAKYAKKSILSGLPVWFAADVCKDFNPFHSALDDNLTADMDIFGQNYRFPKGDRITFRNLQANHAMTLVGVNIDHKNKPESWQVENSWGYWDNETPGEDGFLYMSHSWFKKNVMQIAVHKNFLSRTFRKMLDQDAVMIDPWDCVAPALKINPVNPPKIYDLVGEQIKKRKR